MKILQVNKFYYPWIGGVEKVVQQIAEGLKDEFETEILVCNDKNERKEEIVNSVKVYRAKTLKIILGMPVSFDFFFLYQKIFKNYDLIFLHYPFPLAFLAYFFFSRNKDLVIWYHSDIVRQRLLEIFFKPFHLYCLKKAKKIFVSNPNLAESSSYLSKFKEKCVIIPFGIDLNYFKEDEEIKKKSLEIRQKYGTPLILSVGRLSYYKGFDYLIKSAINISAKFLIIGEGNLKKKLLDLIKKFKLENKVFIIPPQEDLRPFYLACDIFVLPSIARSEAFGIVILEAMAFKKPIISTELGTGTSWVNLNNETGLVIKPKNVGELEKAIKTLLENEELRRKFSENAYKRVLNFSMERFTDQLKKELKTLSMIN